MAAEEQAILIFPGGFEKWTTGGLNPAFVAVKCVSKTAEGRASEDARLRRVHNGHWMVFAPYDELLCTVIEAVDNCRLRDSSQIDGPAWPALEPSITDTNEAGGSNKRNERWNVAGWRGIWGERCIS